MSDASAAVVLAAGLGSRMRRDAPGAALDPAQADAASRGLKGMIPDARGRPFLDHVLSTLADGGVTDVCLVIGPDHDAIREHYAVAVPERVRVAFAVQAAPRGTADALLTVESWTAGRPFLVLNADNLYPAAAIRALVALGGPGLVAFERDTLVRESNIEAERIGAYAVLTLRPDDTLAGIVEKPAPSAKSTTASGGVMRWISMNLWRFDRQIFAACRDVPLSLRGEFELPLAVELAINRGLALRVVRMAAGVLDLSNRGDIGEVSQRLADRDIQP